MHTEIHAAAQHIAALVRVDGQLSSQRANALVADLSARLASRYASCWYADDGERGSAFRALTWQVQAGGEGLDKDIAAALVRTLGKSRSVAAMLPTTFTMWVDPGCVAMRTEPAATSAANYWTPAVGTVKVIFGSQPATAMPIRAKTPPAALRINIKGHERLQSWASSTSSVSSYTRSSSPGAYSTSPSEDGDSCPSLTGASSIHSGCSDVDDSEASSSACSEVSIDDLIDRATYKHFDFVDADEELELSSALRRRTMHTMANVDDTICEEADEEDSDDEGDETVQGIDMHSSKKQSLTCYDGGNVGVLGGGVRLGGAAPRAQKPTAIRAPISLSSLWSNSVAKQDANPWAAPMGQMLTAADAQFVIVNGVAIPIGAAPAKRSRTRGRRSRGRGAGRAARRQAAAALRAQEQQAAAGTAEPTEIQAGNGLEGSSPTAIGGALGLSVQSAEVTKSSSNDADESARIMSVVRQRAEEVAKDVARRQQQQQQATQMQRSHSASVLPTAVRSRFPAQSNALPQQPPQLHRLQHQRSQPQLAQLPRGQQQQAPPMPAMPQQFVRAGAPALRHMNNVNKPLPQHRSTGSLSDMSAGLYAVGNNNRMPPHGHNNAFAPHFPSHLPRHGAAHFAPHHHQHHHAHSMSLSMLPPLAHALPAVPMY